MNCPKCSSDQTVKNGSRQNEKQNFKCLPCGRQFVENPSPHYQIPQDTKDLVDRLLLEKIPLAGIARAAQVSERWVQYYANDKYSNSRLFKLFLVFLRIKLFVRILAKKSPYHLKSDQILIKYYCLLEYQYR